MDTNTYTTLDTDDWELVGHMTKKNPKTVKPKVEPPHIPFNELCDTLRQVLSKYSNRIVAGFVYGSRARETNRPDSDADLLIFWKSRVHVDDLREIRTRN